MIHSKYFRNFSENIPYLLNKKAMSFFRNCLFFANKMDLLDLFKKALGILTPMKEAKSDTLAGVKVKKISSLVFPFL